MSLNSRRTVYLLVVLAGLLVFHQIAGVFFWSSAQLFRSATAAAHVPWFAGVTLVLCELARIWIKGRSRQLGVALGAALLLALTTEAAQLLIAGRNASLLDVGRNLLGFTAGAAVWVYLRERAALTQGQRAGLVAICIGAMLLGTAPATYQGAVRVYLASIAPDLVRADTRLGRAPLASNRHVLVVDGGAIDPALAGQAVFQARLPDARWPGITLREPFPDWSGYDRLLVGVHVSGSEPMRLTVRLQLGEGLGPLYTEQVSAGTSIWSVPLARLFPGGQVDGQPVRELILYSNADASGRVLALHTLRLER
jgi:hypothetical protein